MKRDAKDVSLRRSLIAALVSAGLLAGCVGAWAAVARLSGAVIAPGTVIAEGFIKKVQHATGGIVSEINVRDGSEVRAGDILLRLDETIARTTFSIVSRTIDELQAREARLAAEQNGDDEVQIPPELLDRISEPYLGRLIAAERRLFETRLTSRQGQRAQLSQRIEQLSEQMQGMQEQLRAKSLEIELIGRELISVRELWNKNLVPINRVTATERDSARLIGERGALVGSIAQTKGRVTETELQIAQIDQDLRGEVGKELAELRGRVGELQERRAAAADQLARTIIRAPLDGIVHQMSVHTIGGVIGPGDTLMFIVPRDNRLSVESKLAPRDIDRIGIGQEAKLRFSAFDQRTTPEIQGTVTFISADTAQDPKANAPFYTIRISPSDADVSRLGMRLVPGMPVEAFISTGDRTVVSYFLKPLSDQIARTWRE